MNLENLVTSFELSKRLKEAGVEQNSLFSWVKLPEDLGGATIDRSVLIHERWKDSEHFSAYLAGELLAMLPNRDKNKNFLFCSKGDDGTYDCFYAKVTTNPIEIKQHTAGKTLAEAAGNLLLKIKEGGK